MGARQFFIQHFPYGYKFYISAADLFGTVYWHVLDGANERSERENVKFGDAKVYSRRMYDVCFQKLYFWHKKYGNNFVGISRIYAFE